MRPYHPYEHQLIGSRFLREHARCSLVADMGLGKTSMVLSTLNLLKLTGSAFFPALVIAPKRVAQMVWAEEAAKWDLFKDLTVTKVLGARERRTAALKRNPIADLYAINYDNVPWLVDQFHGKPWPFKIVVADESTRLKSFRLNGGGVRARALARIAKQTGRWINLTGTPAPNGLTDLWGQYWFLDFGERLMRTYTGFLERWFFVNQYTHEVTAQPGAQEAITSAVSDITMALRAEDWLGVERPLFYRVEVELPESARKVYDAMEDEYFATVDAQDIEAPAAAVAKMKLLQIASGSIYDSSKTEHALHDAKLDALDDIVEESGEPVLVAYWFKFDVPRIQRRFPHARVLNTAQDVHDWNAGKIPVLLVHPQSAGHGLNLQDGGRTLAFFTQIYDSELRSQVIERIGPARQKQSGHNRTVRVYDIVARNTEDENVLDVIEKKLSVEAAFKRARARRSM